MKTLTDNGRADLALRIAANTTYPSFEYMIERVRPPYGNYGTATVLHPK